MARRGGVVSRLQEVLEDRTGLTLAERERVDLLEATARDYRSQNRELELLGWSVMDYMNGNSQEVNAQTRRQWAAKARVVWLQDTQAGAATDLMNDFVFGRGVPKPRAKDPEVQKVIDEFWDDPDNQLILTSYSAQLGLGTDLSLQANLFFLVFDDGKDGKIKLGLLNHDEVENVVVDPDFRQRVLYYLARHHRREWDYENDKPKIDYNPAQDKVLYYAHWRNVEQAKEEGAKLDTPPAAKLGEGHVYHCAINRTSEQVFGNPPMRRLLRWYSAYNDFMAARVDMAQAAAAFIMRRKVKGTPTQVTRLASQAISRASELAGVSGREDVPQFPPRGGAIMTENENVTHENMNLNSNAGAAAQDAQMIRASISAGTRFPQSYYGDASNSNLATATSLELPVLKAVESRQEVFEGVFRWAIDRCIERAVDTGRISKTMPNETGDTTATDGESPFGPADLGLQQGYEAQNADETETERDLSYEFSMPSPLRRMMTDLVTAITQIASTFDPNGTNIELSRILLTIALGEGLEMQEPAEAVKAIFPQGYQDPALAGAFGGGAPPGPGAPGAPGADGQMHNEANPYGAQGFSPDYQANGGGQPTQQAAVSYSRYGTPIVWREQGADMEKLVHAEVERLVEQRFKDLPEGTQKRMDSVHETDRLFGEDVVPVVTERLTAALNGNHSPSPQEGTS